MTNSPTQSGYHYLPFIYSRLEKHTDGLRRENTKMLWFATSNLDLNEQTILKKKKQISGLQTKTNNKNLTHTNEI